MRGNIPGVYVLLNLIYRLLRPHPSGLGFKGYSGIIKAFIYIFKCVLYSAISRIGFYTNIRVKVG